MFEAQIFKQCNKVRRRCETDQLLFVHHRIAFPVDQREEYRSPLQSQKNYQIDVVRAGHSEEIL